MITNPSILNPKISFKNLHETTRSMPRHAHQLGKVKRKRNGVAQKIRQKTGIKAMSKHGVFE